MTNVKVDFSALVAQDQGEETFFPVIQINITVGDKTSQREIAFRGMKTTLQSQAEEGALRLTRRYAHVIKGMLEGGNVEDLIDKMVSKENEDNNDDTSHVSN